MQNLNMLLKTIPTYDTEEKKKEKEKDEFIEVDGIGGLTKRLKM